MNYYEFMDSNLKIEKSNYEMLVIHSNIDVTLGVASVNNIHLDKQNWFKLETKETEEGKTNQLPKEIGRAHV